MLAVSFVDVNPANGYGAFTGCLPRLGQVNLLVDTHLTEVRDLFATGFHHELRLQLLTAHVVEGNQSVAVVLVQALGRAVVAAVLSCSVHLFK